MVLNIRNSRHAKRPDLFLPFTSSPPKALHLSKIIMVGQPMGHRPLLHLLLFLLSALPSVLSEIKNTRISGDSRPLILFEQFGYSPGGKALISISGASWQPWIHLREHPSYDPSLMGFFLIQDALYPRILNESLYTLHFCALSSHFATPILTFNDLTTNATVTTKSVDIARPDEYSLLFGSCEPELEVTMDVRTEMYNVVNGKKDYLPAGKTPLPMMYLVSSLVYFAFFLVWIGVCFRQRWTMDKIHVVMGALLLFKALKLICAAEDLWHVKQTGSPHGWDVAFYIFGFFKGVLLFTVIVLIGTGWSFLKPYLQEREKQVLMIVIPMQVVENIASVVIGETGPAEREWLTWNQIFLLVDIICCAAVFFPIIWSIRSLKEASKADGKAARNLQKLTLFKQFYIVVVAYLYFTRVVVSALGALLSYQHRWGMALSAEGASLAFYLFVFYNFRPVERNPYLFDGDEEEEAAAGILEMEEVFEL